MSKDDVTLSLLAMENLGCHFGQDNAWQPKWMVTWTYNGEIAFWLKPDCCGETDCVLCHKVLLWDLVEHETAVFNQNFWSRLFTGAVKAWLFSAVPFIERFIMLINKKVSLSSVKNLLDAMQISKQWRMMTHMPDFGSILCWKSSTTCFSLL